MNIADEPAFPCDHDDFGPEYGLSKRDYFAAVVLQGLASRTDICSHAHLAKEAVSIANCLIKELEK